VDRWTRLEGGVAVVRHLRSSRDQVADDLLKRLVLHRRRCDGVDAQAGQSIETMLPRRRANESQPSRLRHFSHWLRRIGSAGTRGPAGSRSSSTRP
jgi:hypothetical protein